MSFNPTAEQIAEHDRRNRASAFASELHPHPNPLAPRICEGCGCTDEDACLDPETGAACYWVEGVDIDICSCCAAIASRMADADEADVARQIEEPRVRLYSDHDADVAIRELRRAARA